jgi:hypothetical protein
VWRTAEPLRARRKSIEDIILKQTLCKLCGSVVIIVIVNPEELEIYGSLFSI